MTETKSKYLPMGRNSQPEMLCKKVFLKISKNLQEINWVGVYFIIKFQVSFYISFPEKIIKPLVFWRFQGV